MKLWQRQQLLKELVTHGQVVSFLMELKRDDLLQRSGKPLKYILALGGNLKSSLTWEKI